MTNFTRKSLANDTYTLMGWIIASMSLVSFSQRVLSIGLADMASRLVAYYRQLAHAVFWIPEELLNITLPSSLIDFWALSFVCAGAYVRCKDVEDARAFRNFQLEKPSIKLRAAIFFVFGITGISLFIPLSVLSIYTYTEGDITRDALKNLLVIVSTVFAFFIFNAFSPSA